MRLTTLLFDPPRRAPHHLSNRDTFINMCKKLSTEILGSDAFKDQGTAMDEGMKLPNDKKLRDAMIEGYATINENMKFLGEEGKSFTMRELNKQIKKMLTPRMRFEYLKLGGDTLKSWRAASSGRGSK